MVKDGHVRENRDQFVRYALALLAVAASAIAATSVQAQQKDAGHDAAAQANNPLANMKAVNFQNMYTGEVSGLDQDANQFMLRYAQPVKLFGGQWLMRATAPLNTVPTIDGHETGLGDLNVLAAYLFDTGSPAVSFGFGPQVTVPTASSHETGSEKLSVGFANVLFNATSHKFQWGYLLTWQASVAGDGNAPDVNAGAFQPFLFYQLGQGWYLRSTGIWTYDFESDGYAIPVGLGAGRVIKTHDVVANIFVEPQYSVVTGGDGQPEWNIYGGLNFQF